MQENLIDVPVLSNNNLVKVLMESANIHNSWKCGFESRQKEQFI